MRAPPSLHVPVGITSAVRQSELEFLCSNCASKKFSKSLHRPRNAELSQFSVLENRPCKSLVPIQRGCFSFYSPAAITVHAAERGEVATPLRGLLKGM